MIRQALESNPVPSWAVVGAMLACAGCEDSMGTASTSQPVLPAPVTVDTPTARGIELASPYRPTPQPDRIILTWTGDPSSSQAVTWRTDTSVSVGLAEFGVAGHSAEFTRRTRQIKAKTAALTTDLASVHYHSVEFEALSAATRYAYRVGDGKTWTEWFHFTTASDQPAPFSFVYFGDAQNDLKSMWSRVIREAFINSPKARFLLHAGDLVNNSNRDAEWGEWFHAGGWLNAMIPSIPTMDPENWTRK